MILDYGNRYYCIEYWGSGPSNYYSATVYGGRSHHEWLKQHALAERKHRERILKDDEELLEILIAAMRIL